MVEAGLRCRSPAARFHIPDQTGLARVWLGQLSAKVEDPTLAEQGV
jgi:hypothetical protein